MRQREFLSITQSGRSIWSKCWWRPCLQFLRFGFYKMSWGIGAGFKAQATVKGKDRPLATFWKPNQCLSSLIPKTQPNDPSTHDVALKLELAGCGGYLSEWPFRLEFQSSVPAASWTFSGHVRTSHFFSICTALASDKPQHSRVALKRTGVDLRQIWAWVPALSFHSRSRLHLITSNK